MIAPWAMAEVATADLGDERLDARLELLLSAFGKRPNLSIPAACGGRAEMEAAYRFFDNDKVTFDKVLKPHIARTKERLREQKVALLVQDSSEIELTRPQRQVAGVGTLDGSRHGFLLHEMQAFTPEGIPLGTVWAEIVNRTDGVAEESRAEKQSRRQRTPIEEKESLRWLTGLRQARALAQALPTVECVCVADREADVYEWFAEPRGDRPVHWLIRACQDRALSESSAHMRNQVLTTPVLYEVELLIRGRQAKAIEQDRVRNRNRETRQAKVQVRATALTLRPPWRRDRKLPAITVNVVLVREANPPPGETAVEWILITTLPIDTSEQVRTIVEYYCVRWCIEIHQADCRSSGRLYLGGSAA